MKYTTPKVSVIIPVYNVEKFLHRCLDSIAAQIYRDFEVLLIDDGSEDLSGKICDEYASEYPYMKVFHEENKGVVCARKTGVENARGRYIAFADADDWVEAEFLSVLAGIMEKERPDIVISGYWKNVKGEELKSINRIKPGVYEREGILEFYKKMLHYGGFYEFGIQPFLWNKLFRRDMLLDCMDIEPRIYEGEDVAIIFPYMLKAEKIAVITDCLYHYMIRPTSSSKNRKFNFQENTSRLYLYLNQKFQQSEHYGFLLPQLNAYLRMMIYYEDRESFIETEKDIFPFYDVPKDSKIILYGAGYVGKVYYNQLALSGYCQVAAWVDAAYQKEEYARMGVLGLETIYESEYDYIVIAVKDTNVVNSIKKDLLECHVPEEKIIPTRSREA